MEKIINFMTIFDFSKIPEQINDTITDSFSRFIGFGYYHIIYLIGLFVLFINFKNKNDNKDSEISKKNTMLFGVYTGIIFFLSLNVYYAWFYIKATGNDYTTYWRTYWMLPISIGIGYMFTKIISIQLKDVKKYLLILLSFIILAVSGDAFGFNEQYAITNNYYKLPDEFVDVVMFISNYDLEYKKIAGPEEIFVYTRLIDGNIIISETRHDLNGLYDNSIISMINDKNITAIKYYCKEKKVNFVIVPKNEEGNYLIIEDFNNLYENDKYVIYLVDF